jgi:hypothetical protein
MINSISSIYIQETIKINSIKIQIITMIDSIGRTAHAIRMKK